MPTVGEGSTGKFQDLGYPQGQVRAARRGPVRGSEAACGPWLRARLGAPSREQDSHRVPDAGCGAGSTPRGNQRIVSTSGKSTFVGFGFGAIQAGLFLREALQCGAFQRVVVAEVVPEVVAALRSAGGCYALNVAHADGVQQELLGPIEAFDPQVGEDREALIRAVSDASEIATAVPSVRFYRGVGPGSIHRILARGLEARGPRPVLVYTAENDNHAAEALATAVLEEVPRDRREEVARNVCFANTVIGKMSGVIADPLRVHESGLRTIVHGDPRAFLVEEFRRILISRVEFGSGAPFARGISAFEEKASLLPFEEAKLYGHNASHALLAYLAALRGLTRMDQVTRIPGALAFARAAVLEESGAGLIARWGGQDPLFSAEGLGAYMDDLLVRMTNPYLEDLVERVTRDPERKLAWNDRLIGALRLALERGVRPRRFALGAAAALVPVVGQDADAATCEEALRRLWKGSSPPQGEAVQVLQNVREAQRPLRLWLEGKLELSDV